MDTCMSPGDQPRLWTFWPLAQPRAIVQIIHGMIEHSGRYDAFARQLNAHGYAVCAGDHMGHGGSAKDKDALGVFDQGWHRLVGDTVTLSMAASSRYPGIPLVYLGHSMGSFVLRALLSQEASHASGAIIMGTAQYPAWLTEAGIFIASVFEKALGPRHRNRLLSYVSTDRHQSAFKDLSQPYAWLTQDKAYQQAYAQDPYCQFVPTTSMQKNIYQVLNYVSSPRTIRRMPSDLPLLILAGSQDPVGNFGIGVMAFYRLLIASGHQEATLKLYPQARHELLNDLCRDLVLEDILQWLKVNVG